MYRLPRKLRLVVVLMMAVVAMMFITPVRNIFLGPLLPGLLRGVPTSQILKAEWYAVSSTTAALSSCTVAAGDATAFTHQSEQLQKLLHIEFTQAQPRQQDKEMMQHAQTWLRESSQRLERYGKFQPRLSLRDKARLLLTLQVLRETLTLHNISHFLTDGSLLGAYRHGGIIPWDDDIDLGVDTTDLEKVQRVLSCVPGYTLRVQPNMAWKFFAQDAQVVEVSAHSRVRHAKVLQEEDEKVNYQPEFHPAEDVVMRFPFVDIFLFTTDGTYFWPITNYVIPTNLFHASDLYPLGKVDFEGLPGGVPVPHRGASLLRRIYTPSVCVSADHNHKLGHSIDFVSVPCEELAEMYTVYTV